MSEEYALYLLRQEYQRIARDMQLQGPGQNMFFDHRQVKLKSLGDTINQLLIISKKEEK